MNGTGLVRQPSSRLAEGIVTHITRIPVDVALAKAQHSKAREISAARSRSSTLDRYEPMALAISPEFLGLSSRLGPRQCLARATSSALYVASRSTVSQWYQEMSLSWQ